MTILKGDLLYCYKCQHVWQQPLSGYSSPTYYLKGSLPTIGLIREICPKCKKQGETK